MRRLLLLLMIVVLGQAIEPRVASAPIHDLNDRVLRVLPSMPTGGGYSTDSSASRLLTTSMAVTPGGLSVRPEAARPSYCSGATYLVFLRLCQQLTREGALTLDEPTLFALLVRGQRDGHGIWGRWNANGPGTARLFHQLGLGVNFTDFQAARPGDFMKIFWTTEVGRNERGHSVIFLGREAVDGSERVRFWSSNKPLGYGEKTVPRSKIAQAVFSRLEEPQNLVRINGLPDRDPYLASLLSVRSSFAELREKCGCKF